MHIVKEEPKKLIKISKNDYRKMMAKEKMLNGKEFQNCSRWELLEMIVAMSRAFGILNQRIKHLEGSDQPLPDEMKERIVAEVEELMETVQQDNEAHLNPQ